MTPRHALQAAALQFGRDGTDRSLSEMLDVVAEFPSNQWLEIWGAATLTTTGVLTADELAALPESFKEQMRRRPLLHVSRVPESYPAAIPATLTDESHAEVDG